MPKDVFQFSCPCCGKAIEVETRTGRARAVKPEEKRGGGDLDQLVQKQQQEQQRLTDVFSQAQKQQARQQEHLDDLLQKAKQEAKKDQDERPPSPFDLD